VHVQIVAVGKLKEQYLVQGIEEYKKRMGRYGRLEILEVKEESFTEPLSDRRSRRSSAGKGNGSSRSSSREALWWYWIGVDGPSPPRSWRRSFSGWPWAAPISWCL